MKFLMEYDLGEGPVRTWVSVQAQVGWELRTHKKIGGMAEGIGMTDIVGLLLEQLKVEDRVPENVVNEAGLAKRLVDVNMLDPDDLPADVSQSVQDTIDGFPTYEAPSLTVP